MKGMGWRGWRWAVAGLAIGASVVLLGFALRAWDLGAAANIAQLLSLLPIAIGMIGWARTRGEAASTSSDALEALDELVRTIEEKTDRIEQSITQQNNIGEGLLKTRDRLTQATTQLTIERQKLHDRLLASQSGISATAEVSEAERERLEAEVARLRRDLQDTQQRLAVAERLRGEAQRRLEESERQRAQGERLLREAHAQATEARRHLADIDARPVLESASLASRALPVIADTQLMGDNDQQAVEEIFRYVDDVFHQEAVTLDQVQNDLAVTATATHRLTGPDGAGRVDASDDRHSTLRLPKRRGWKVFAGIGSLTAGLTLVAIYLAGPLLTPSKGHNPQAITTYQSSSATPKPAQKPTPQPAWTISWTYRTGDWVYSSPAVVDGVVYVGSGDGKVYALDALTGAVRWTHKIGGRVYSSPAVVDGVVYVGSGDGKVYALDALTGAVRWTHKTGDWVYSSPAVVDGVVYVGSGDGKVYALDALTGAVRWTHKTGDDVGSSPAVVDGVVYVGSDDHKVYALDALTGAVRWTHKTGNWVRSSPAVVDGVVYVGNGDGDDDNSYKGKVYALDALTGAVRWTHKIGNWVGSSPAVVDGVVYVGSDDHKVYALDALTGAVRWTHKTGNWVRSSPAVVDGVVYVGSNDHKVYALDALTGAVRWTHKTGNWVYSSPAVVDGVVYVGSNDDKVYALDARTG
ncbi:PQQ-binding-like beta-propeller repeat protein [Streptosporangium sp. NPDC005286]|uniref:outer membrane protein assembly factor BamB family protein n=1 Tax=Streptosporangium sp. NPDC005286 TaxID=3154463 RepID=UPI0033BD60A6